MALSQSALLQPLNGLEVAEELNPKLSPEQAKLRENLHSEIEMKTKACSNSTFECSLPRVEGHCYCLRHILQDTNSAYKQCAYSYPLTNRRCLQAAPKYDTKKNKHFTMFCFEHSRLSQLTKTRTAVGRLKKPDDPEGFLSGLAHYVNMDGAPPGAEDDIVIDVENTMTVDPTTEIDATAIKERSRKILDYASDSSSDGEPATLENTWPGHDLDNSDYESLDSETEDPLKHAGIYTAEEATRITKDKLIRLHSMYVEQFGRLGHVLREKRRKYLHALRKERETCCSIHNQARDSVQERHLYAKLKALNKYHRRHGVEAVLHKKYYEKRAKAFGGGANKSSIQNRCTFQEGGVKCMERAIPCCKFCRRHVLEDKKQVLFRACGIERSGVVCQEAVPMIFDEAACLLHIGPPPDRGYALRKYESDDPDDEEDKALGNQAETKQKGDIKVETSDHQNVTISHDLEAHVKLEPVEGGGLE